MTTGDEIRRRTRRTRAALRSRLLLAAAVVVLTLLTELGGLILIAAVSGVAVAERRRRTPLRWPSATRAAAFVVLYMLATIAAVPPLASLAGREPLPCYPATGEAPLAALSPLYCLLNRNYVVPQVETTLVALAEDLARRHPGTQVRYLDAGFPFGLGLPMLPHLSHGDGHKVDLAFFYADEDGYRPDLSRSPIGYWGFERPEPGDPLPCAGHDAFPTLRWDMAWLQGLWPEVTLEAQRTSEMIRWLAGPGAGHGVRRMLLEPYLAARLGAEGPRVRFQGCRAARHDDHVHVEIGG